MEAPPAPSHPPRVQRTPPRDGRPPARGVVHIIERVGRFHRVADFRAGAVVPVLERVVCALSIRDEDVKVPRTRVLSADRVYLSVGGLATVRVIDPRLAAYSVDDADATIKHVSAAALRAAAATFTSTTLQSSPELLAEPARSRIHEVLSQWGCQCTCVSLGSIRISDARKSSKSKQKHKTTQSGNTPNNSTSTSASISNTSSRFSARRQGSLLAQHLLDDNSRLADPPKPVSPTSTTPILSKNSSAPAIIYRSAQANDPAAAGWLIPSPPRSMISPSTSMPEGLSPTDLMAARAAQARETAAAKRQRAIDNAMVTPVPRASSPGNKLPPASVKERRNPATSKPAHRVETRRSSKERVNPDVSQSESTELLPKKAASGEVLNVDSTHDVSFDLDALSNPPSVIILAQGAALTHPVLSKVLAEKTQDEKSHISEEKLPEPNTHLSESLISETVPKTPPPPPSEESAEGPSPPLLGNEDSRNTPEPLLSEEQASGPTNPLPRTPEANETVHQSPNQQVIMSSSSSAQLPSSALVPLKKRLIDNVPTATSAFADLVPQSQPVVVLEPDDTDDIDAQRMYSFDKTPPAPPPSPPRLAQSKRSDSDLATSESTTSAVQVTASIPNVSSTAVDDAAIRVASSAEIRIDQPSDPSPVKFVRTPPAPPNTFEEDNQKDDLGSETSGDPVDNDVNSAIIVAPHPVIVGAPDDGSGIQFENTPDTTSPVTNSSDENEEPEANSVREEDQMEEKQDVVLQKMIEDSNSPSSGRTLSEDEPNPEASEDNSNVREQPNDLMPVPEEAPRFIPLPERGAHRARKIILDGDEDTHSPSPTKPASELEPKAVTSVEVEDVYDQPDDMMPVPEEAPRFIPPRGRRPHRAREIILDDDDETPVNTTAESDGAVAQTQGRPSRRTREYLTRHQLRQQRQDDPIEAVEPEQELEVETREDRRRRRQERRDRKARREEKRRQIALYQEQMRQAALAEAEAEAEYSDGWRDDEIAARRRERRSRSNNARVVPIGSDDESDSGFNQESRWPNSYVEEDYERERRKNDREQDRERERDRRKREFERAQNVAENRDRRRRGREPTPHPRERSDRDASRARDRSSSRSRDDRERREKDERRSRRRQDPEMDEHLVRPARNRSASASSSVSGRSRSKEREHWEAADSIVTDRSARARSRSASREGVSDRKRRSQSTSDLSRRGYREEEPNSKTRRVSGDRERPRSRSRARSRRRHRSELGPSQRREATLKDGSMMVPIYRHADYDDSESDGANEKYIPWYCEGQSDMEENAGDLLRCLYISANGRTKCNHARCVHRRRRRRKLLRRGRNVTYHPRFEWTDSDVRTGRRY